MLVHNSFVIIIWFDGANVEVYEPRRSGHRKKKINRHLAACSAVSAVIDRHDPSSGGEPDGFLRVLLISLISL